MAKINIEELSQISYLNLKEVQGRFIASLMFHDAGEWRMWMAADDRLISVKAWPAEAFYFSRNAESETDIYLHFLDFIAQRASFLELEKPFSGLHDDILNLATSFAKLEHLHSTRDVIGTGVSRMVVTEIEYLFSVCRSIFDLLQEIVCVIWKAIQLTDTSVEKKPLKETFSKMMFFQGREATSDDLISRYGLPQPLADYYVRNRNFFFTLRKFRDAVIHRGTQVQTVFQGDTDFLIRRLMQPFSDMSVWTEEEVQPNDLVPLRPALSIVVYKTLSACEDFSSTLQEIIRFPEPLVPEMRLFMRCYFNEAFSRAINDANRRLMSHA